MSFLASEALTTFLGGIDAWSIPLDVLGKRIELESAMTNYRAKMETLADYRAVATMLDGEDIRASRFHMRDPIVRRLWVSMASLGVGWVVGGNLQA